MLQSPTDSRHGNCRVCRFGRLPAVAAAGRSEPYRLQPTPPEPAPSKSRVVSDSPAHRRETQCGGFQRSPQARSGDRWRAAHGFADGFGARVDALIGPHTSPGLLELIRNGARATNPRGFMQGVELGLSDGYSPDEVAAKVTVPVLLISGSEDRINPIETNAALLHKAVPSSRVEIIEGIGHLPHLEAPERVNALLRQFLTQ